LATRLTTLHFAPTFASRANLLREGVAPPRIFVTGNTVIDALLLARAMIRRESPAVPGVPARIMRGCQPLVLITGHRRESFGPDLSISVGPLPRWRDVSGNPIHLSRASQSARAPTGPPDSRTSRGERALDPASGLSAIRGLDEPATLLLTDSAVSRKRPQASANPCW
jgi:hypothetical protein